MAYEKELQFAKDLAYEAGNIMRKYYRADQQVEIKTDKHAFTSPLTIADTEINDMVIERVKTEFAEDGVLGEEASWNVDNLRLWVCDPIDGTSAYVIKVPASMFSIALVVNGRPIVAVTYNPWVDDLYHAVKGEGSYRNNQHINVSSKNWEDSLHVTGTRGKVYRAVKEELRSVSNISVYDTLGGVLKGCLVAEGAVDAWIFEHEGAHDVAATKLIIEEAGGKVTDIDGNDQAYDKPVNGTLSTNGLIHDELLAHIKKVK